MTCCSAAISMFYAIHGGARFLNSVHRTIQNDCIILSDKIINNLDTLDLDSIICVEVGPTLTALASVKKVLCNPNKDCNVFFVYKCGLVCSPSLLFTPHHHKSRQKGAAFGSGSFIQENIERKLKTFVKVSQIPHSHFQ